MSVRKATQEELDDAEGRCYECAFKYLQRIPKEEVHQYRLVHGDMIGTAGEVEGIQYGHAWIEKDNALVLDMRHDLRKKPLELPKEDYYQFNGVIEETVKRYTLKESAIAGIKAGGHFGPWN